MLKPGLSIQTATRLILFSTICLLISTGYSLAQNKKKVEIIHCDLGAYNARIVANAQRLIGNVNITVDGALMWCDSLYSYTNNTVDAFGNVHIVRGDTLNMYADFMNYNPETKLARARRNVKLIDKKVTLTTDSLDYSMFNDVASYNYNGVVKDSTNTLTSKIGQYYVNEKKAYFKTKVDVVTKDYKIKSDTLIYFTNTKKVMLEGPTHIFNEKKDTLYAESGWYDSMRGYARLTKKPRVWNDKQKMKADSVYYDKKKGEGLAMGHAQIQDIKNSMIVVGNKIKYNDLTKIALATDSAILIQYSKTDSLFLHADWLRTMPDTTVTDTTKNARLFLAYHKVRFFRPDFQGKCDSLAYWSKDSTIQMFTEPIIWSNRNQMTADYIEMINRSKDPDEVRMKEDAFIIAMEEDSLRFNQIKGRNMNGFLRKNTLYRIDVNGNGQSNYYARDKDGLVGLNKAESSNICIYLNNGKVKKITFIKSPEGELKPMADIQDGDKLLPGFKWLDELRPKSKNDIFADPVPSANPQLPGKKLSSQEPSEKSDHAISPKKQKAPAVQ